eukprot:Selendium_serpulae@DN2357_c0_g1_i1.p1
MPRPAKIVSGGQTGVDRGALDAAIALGIPHGGWCPLGRIAEDGAIPATYTLTEADTADYDFRTEKNVIDSTATLIIYVDSLTGGTKSTHEYLLKLDRPFFLFDLNGTQQTEAVSTWISNCCPMYSALI